MLIYSLTAVFIVTAMLVVSHLLGERHEQRATGEPYESGIVSEGSARLRLSAKFYLVAMFFVIFDLEAVFLYAWAVAAREAGWPGYIEAAVFIGLLGLTLVYLWRTGGLDWASVRRRFEEER